MGSILLRAIAGDGPDPLPSTSIGGIAKMGKKVSAITIADVPVIFDDKCIERLAQIGRLPPDAKLQVFAEGVRRGVRTYTQAACLPSRNDVHHEVEALHRAADRDEYEAVADLLGKISSAARDCLAERLTRSSWRGKTFPDAATLRDPAHQRRACEVVHQLCTAGGKRREGRRRPGGKRSRSTYQGGSGSRHRDRYQKRARRFRNRQRRCGDTECPSTVGESRLA